LRPCWPRAEEHQARRDELQQCVHLQLETVGSAFSFLQTCVSIPPSQMAVPALGVTVSRP
jgi:hypothetical protein